MGDNSAIEWLRGEDGRAGATWNPVTGCSKVSAGCKNCYAERWALGRLKGSPGYPGLPWTAANAERNVVLRPERLSQPFRWKRPRRIFVNSLSDLFHEEVPFKFAAAVFGVMAYASWHDYLILTKRSRRMLEFFEWLSGAVGSDGAILPCNPLMGCEMQAARWIGDDYPFVETLTKAINTPTPPRWPPRNLWLGISAEDERTLHDRVPGLLKAPAAVRFLSLEPLLGPVVLDDVGGPWLSTEVDHAEDTKLDWVIVGGESGPNARPTHPAWVRSVRDECLRFGVPFFFKQWGEYGPYDSKPSAPYAIVDPRRGRRGSDRTAPPRQFDVFGSVVMRRLGKKASGRLLDGKLHDAYPEERIHA